MEEKHFIKQTDMMKLIDLIQVRVFIHYLLIEDGFFRIEGNSNEILDQFR